MAGDRRRWPFLRRLAWIELVLVPLGAAVGLLSYLGLRDQDPEGVNTQTLVWLPILFALLFGLFGIFLAAISGPLAPGDISFEWRLDIIQGRFESGDVLDAAARLRKLRLLAEEEEDGEALADIDDMAKQMRAHLEGPELAKFNETLASYPSASN